MWIRERCHVWSLFVFFFLCGKSSKEALLANAYACQVIKYGTRERKFTITYDCENGVKIFMWHPSYFITSPCSSPTSRCIPALVKQKSKSVQSCIIRKGRKNAKSLLIRWREVKFLIRPNNYLRILHSEALSVLVLCAPVFIFTSSSSALLGCPGCGLSVWLSLLAIFNTLFWVYVNFFKRKRTKHKNTRSLPFSCHTKIGRRRLLGAQSINTEKASLQVPLVDSFFLCSEGWEQSGLFEFYKAKLDYIKKREESKKERRSERVRSHSRWLGRSKLLSELFLCLFVCLFRP